MQGVLLFMTAYTEWLDAWHASSWYPFYRFRVYEKVGISLVKGYERKGNWLFPRRAKRANRRPFYGCAWKGEEYLRHETCLVPVRRFPSPSRSIRFGDVSEANGRETFSHGPRDLKRFGREEKWGLGTRQDMRPKSAISTPKQSLIFEHHKGRILFYLFFFLHWHLTYSATLSFIKFYCQRNSYYLFVFSMIKPIITKTINS